jgi:transposase
MVRFIGMDIHRDFCEVAISEGGKVRSAGRIQASVEQLDLFAQSLACDDVVALEATGGAGLIVELLEPHVAAVLVANTRKLPQISRAKAKTDRLDARTLARLAAAGLLETVWAPTEEFRALRRVSARRESLVRARTRAKNEAHAVLARNLCGRPPISDCFGRAGREWLAGLQLPLDERLTLDGCVRQVDFLDQELEALERALAEQALASPQIRRLMTVPGVGVHTAAAFLAAVGDIRRFPTARRLVGYLGLDPRVRQSGNAEAARPDLQGRFVPSPAHARRGRVVGRADPGPAACVLRAHPRAQGAANRGDRDRAQARLPVLVPARSRAGLRIRAPLDDPLQAP